MIYFIKAGDFIKIGYTKNDLTFKVRLQTYSTSNPYDIEVINIIEGNVDLEKNILNYFVKYHCKGEWFYFNEEIIKYAKVPFELPISKFKKPLKEGNKIINENFDKIITEYKNGMSLQKISEKFNINRSRLIKHIPEEIKRTKNEWFKLNDKRLNNRNKEIICHENNQTYISISEASRQLNINKVSIRRVCIGKYKQAGGLTFNFTNNN